MQLTKDDVDIHRDVYNPKSVNREYLDYSKFQQVVEFYEKYKNERFAFKEKYPEEYKEFESSRYSFFDLWLFSYCFKLGLQ